MAQGYPAECPGDEEEGVCINRSFTSLFHFKTRPKPFSHLCGGKPRGTAATVAEIMPGRAGGVSAAYGDEIGPGGPEFFITFHGKRSVGFPGEL